jgi:hypothetical protein
MTTVRFAENAPAAQSAQPEPAVEYRPAAHIAHAARPVAPAGDPVPAAQSRHAALLVALSVLEYLPALQSTQPEPTVENFPAAHGSHVVMLAAPVPAAQPAHALAPAAANAPAAHSRHAPLLVAPVVPEYLPAAQSMQVLALAAEYLPAAQAEQELAPVFRVPAHEYTTFLHEFELGQVSINVQPDRAFSVDPEVNICSPNFQLSRSAHFVGSPYPYFEFSMSM